jgi:DNA-binding NtrC family response regulator
MDGTSESPDGSQAQPFTALVVTPRSWERNSLHSIVRSLELRALSAADFHAGRQLLAHRPLLLMTELQLGEYNGLHLVLYATRFRPGLPSVVTSRVSDVVLQREAEGIGATFVEVPTTIEELTAALLRTIAHDGVGSEPVGPPFERRRSQRRADAAAGVNIERRLTERRRRITSILKEAAGRLRGDVPPLRF